jgi:hypothetical protein
VSAAIAARLTAINSKNQAKARMGESSVNRRKGRAM